VNHIYKRGKNKRRRAGRIQCEVDSEEEEEGGIEDDQLEQYRSSKIQKTCDIEYDNTSNSVNSSVSSSPSTLYPQLEIAGTILTPITELNPVLPASPSEQPVDSLSAFWDQLLSETELPW